MPLESTRLAELTSSLSGSPPALPPRDEAGRDEFGSQEFANLVQGVSPAIWSSAVYSLFMDARRGRSFRSDLVNTGLVRSAQSIATLGRQVPYSTETMDALDELFGAIAAHDRFASRPNLLVQEYLRTMVDLRDQYRRRARPSGAREVWFHSCWTNSITASLADDAKSVEIASPAFGDSPLDMDWTVATLAFLAFRPRDNPLAPESIPLWERWGQQYGLRVSCQRSDLIMTEWTVVATEKLLIKCTRRASERFRQIAQDALRFQLDTHLPARIEILNRKLRQEAPSSWWEDEYEP